MNRLDLAATDSKDRRYAISVKNSREFLKRALCDGLTT